MTKTKTSQERTMARQIETARTTTDEKQIGHILENANRFDTLVVCALAENERVGRNDDFATEMQNRILDSPFAQKDYNYMAARVVAKIAKSKAVQSRIIHGESWVAQRALAKNPDLIQHLQPELAHLALHTQVKMALIERKDLLGTVKNSILMDRSVEAEMKKRTNQDSRNLLRKKSTEHSNVRAGLIPATSND